ncbi:MAG TPA: class I SAM-dependent methyltransferase [Acidimicrobiales bacterium]|nr:class I SAM-dependent methyltransferase [Acidimicrobiales bacterium]
MTDEPTADFLQANRAMWDDSVEIHAASRFYDVAGWLTDGRGPRPDELALIGPVEGLDICHLQCHFGMDTLSLARVGARITGLDFSPAAIARAQALADESGLAARARFVLGTVDEASALLGRAAFDLVYVSLGALCWLPSVARWAHEVAALLRPGGRLFLHDAHPFAQACMGEELVPDSSYFEEVAPRAWDEEETYTDAIRPLTATVSYEWNHSLGEIVNALIGEGMVLDRLIEHDWTSFARLESMVRIADQRYVLPEGSPRLPLSFTLLATRSGS